MRYLFFLLFVFTFSAHSSNQKFIDTIALCSSKIQKNYDIENKIPSKLIIAQAIIESNWGKSRFAIDGNNYFGMRTWDLSQEHLKPKKNKDSKFGLKVYKDVCSSVKDYIDNINTSLQYEDLRRARIIELKLWSRVDPTVLARYLQNYSEEREVYVDKIINQIKKISID